MIKGIISGYFFPVSGRRTILNTVDYVIGSNPAATRSSLDSGKRLFGFVTMGKIPRGPRGIRVLRVFETLAAEMLGGRPTTERS